MAWRGHRDRVILACHLEFMKFTWSPKMHWGSVRSLQSRTDWPRDVGSWKHTHVHKQGYPKKRVVVSLRTECPYSEPTGRDSIQSGFTSKGSSLGKQWFDLSLRCLKWSYCQMQDAHLERECLTGKRANYKFRLLPWRFADPSTCDTGTPRKARNRM